MPKQFTLGKNERLKSRKLIEQLFKEGRSFALFPFRLYYLLSKDEAHITESALRFGVGVSARNFKRAVDRNRLKRLTREAYRLQKMELQEKLKHKDLQLNIFFIYAGKELPEYKVVYDKMGVVLQKIIAEIEQQTK